MKKYYLIIALALLFQSCIALQKNNSPSMFHDFFNRFSKTEIKATHNWKMGDDVLLLRKNNTFRYYSKVFGIVNSGYYSGTYKVEDDVICFSFYKNYKPSFFETDTLLVAKKDYYFVLKNKNSDNCLVVN